ncbi:MAG: hypothetical protein ACP5G4_00715 [bacterium]
MRKLIYGIITIALLATAGFAAFDDYVPDAVASSMGDAPPAIGFGPHSLFGGNGISAGGGYRRSFSYADFDEIGAWASFADEKYGRALLEVSSFGVENLTSETKFGLAYTKPLFSDIHTELGLSAKANIFSLSYESSINGTELGSAMGFTLDFAAEAVVYERTRIRILAENLTATDMGVEGDIELPRAVTGALSYSPYNNTNMMFHVRREAGQDFGYGLGVSASPHEIVEFRLGAATNPDRITGGMGLKYEMVRFDYALKSHPVLPLSHTLTLGIDLAR